MEKSRTSYTAPSMDGRTSALLSRIADQEIRGHDVVDPKLETARMRDKLHRTGGSNGSLPRVQGGVPDFDSAANFERRKRRFAERSLQDQAKRFISLA